MEVTIKNADDKLISIINELSKYNSTPYEIVKRSNSENKNIYNESFRKTIIDAKKECDEAIKSKTAKVISTKEELYKELYEV